MGCEPVMASERWRFVWQICEEARQLPAAERIPYVHANVSNPDIARDALSLLVEPEESVFPSWNQINDSNTAGGGAAVTPEQTLTGVRIGRYVVGHAIGCGATGNVYSARDTELERRVAMKFFKPGSSESRWKVDWLLREAKTASALNHPGIITVHEVIQSEAGLAIVMEFVDGTALRKLCTAPNPADQVIRWGTQIADALSAAHQNGIIHRDIKPENVMIRADGLLKVLDFGLAQSSRRADEGFLTQVWAGTLPYMSPEQASGETLTPATDVFSLGVVFYELLTGRHPFRADTIVETLRAIRRDTPDPPSRKRRNIPKPLNDLIVEMLAKPPERRPDAAEVARRLKELQAPTAVSRSRYRQVGLVAALAAALLGGLWFANDQQHKSAPIALRPVPLTSASGFHSWPDISPDGKSVVYGWGASPDAYTDLYLQRLDQDAPVKLVEAAPGSRIGHAKWSPDGQHIYFKNDSPRFANEGIWVVSKNGSDRHKVLTLVNAELSSGIDVSPDGKRILFSDRPNAGLGRFVLESVNLVSHERTVLTAPQEGWGDWDPRFSPEGKRIAFKRVNKAGDDQLYVMPAAGGTARRITSGRHSIFGHAWLTQGKLLVSMQWDSVIHGLWRISTDGSGSPDSVFQSGFDATMPAVGKSEIAWIDSIEDYNIYSVPLAGGTPVQRIASPMLDSQPAPAPDGRIAYMSRRSGSPQIWIAAPSPATNEIRLTNLKADVGFPAWSPDGSRLVFTVERNGVATIFSAACTPRELSCQSPRPLIEGKHPSWSANSKLVYFTANTKDQIRRIPISGGPATVVVSGLEALASRDGKWLYFRRVDPAPEFWRVRLDSSGGVSGPEKCVLVRIDNGANWQHWTLAGDEILSWESSINSTFSGLRAYNTITKRLRTVVETSTAEYPAVSADGKTVWFARADAAGATVMASEFNR